MLAVLHKKNSHKYERNQAQTTLSHTPLFSSATLITVARESRMHKIFPCVFPLLKCTSSATRGRIQTCVYACESPQSVNMHVHRAPVFVCSPVCMCMCVLLQGLCVRGVEHLNINNCHVGHLGPRSQLAPWAQSHHQHSCHRVQKREERGGGI